MNTALTGQQAAISLSSVGDGIEHIHQGAVIVAQQDDEFLRGLAAPIRIAVGLVAAGAIAFGAHLAGLVLMLVSRLCDGLDGALARLTAPTDRGAFLDIALDFIFYASIPLAFAIDSPVDRALAAAVLLAAFIQIYTLT